MRLFLFFRCLRFYFSAFQYNRKSDMHLQTAVSQSPKWSHFKISFLSWQIRLSIYNRIRIHFDTFISFAFGRIAKTEFRFYCQNVKVKRKLSYNMRKYSQISHERIFLNNSFSNYLSSHAQRTSCLHWWSTIR